MMKLQKLLSSFEMSEDSKKHILNGGITAPPEFVQIAQTTLAGHFLVKSHHRNVVVRPTCVEFYYHEEEEGGIKDYIVYHRNSATEKQVPFVLGTLHHHISGIDITFERGTTPEKAVRAAMLVREFEVDGLNEERSTLIYDALYQQSSLFDGISIKWVDGKQPVAADAFPRKNVALYDANLNKLPAKEHPELAATDDSRFVQDPRCWQFKRRLVNDEDTNTVYLSAWVKNEFPDFFKRFTKVLSEHHIAVEKLKKTTDVWVRDFMPIQVYDHLYVQYQYNPDYLQSEELRKYITDTNAVSKEVGIDTVKTDLVLDGGNVVKVGRYVVLTEKVYAENPNWRPVQIRNMLKRIFHAEVVMLPWDKEGKYGHANGIVKGIDDETVLMTNFGDYDQKLADKIEQVLSSRFTVKKLTYSTNSSEYNWAYINFLRVGNVIILPGLGIPEDQEALQQIQSYYPNCQVRQIACAEVVAQGDALNGITWNRKV